MMAQHKPLKLQESSLYIAEFLGIIVIKIHYLIILILKTVTGIALFLLEYCLTLV